MPISFCALSIAFVAAPSEAFGARLNEIVTTGNWPWWLTESAPLFISKCVKVLSGTAPPFTEAIGVGFADPALTELLVDAEGLGSADEAELPEEVVAVIVAPEVLLVSADGASAERT